MKAAQQTHLKWVQLQRVSKSFEAIKDKYTAKCSQKHFNDKPNISTVTYKNTLAKDIASLVPK